MTNAGRNCICQVSAASTTDTATTQSGMRSPARTSQERRGTNSSGAVSPGGSAAPLSTSRLLSIRPPNTTTGRVHTRVISSVAIIPSGLTFCTSTSMVCRSCRLRYHNRSTSSSSGNAGSSVSGHSLLPPVSRCAERVTAPPDRSSGLPGEGLPLPRPFPYPHRGYRRLLVDRHLLRQCVRLFRA